MANERILLLCGDSIYMKSLEQGLRLLPGVQTIWADTVHPLEDDPGGKGSITTRLSQLTQQKLSAIMLDHTIDNLALFLAYMEQNPNVPIILVDKTEHTFTILSGQHYPGNTLEDLIRVLEKSQAMPGAAAAALQAKNETTQTLSSIGFSVSADIPDMP